MCTILEVKLVSVLKLFCKSTLSTFQIKLEYKNLDMKLQFHFCTLFFINTIRQRWKFLKFQSLSGPPVDHTALTTTVIERGGEDEVAAEPACTVKPGGGGERKRAEFDADGGLPVFLVPGGVAL